MITGVCALPGCLQPVLDWLDSRFCSANCRGIAHHPDLCHVEGASDDYETGRRARLNQWLDLQLLPCQYLVPSLGGAPRVIALWGCTCDETSGARVYTLDELRARRAASGAKL